MTSYKLLLLSLLTLSFGNYAYARNAEPQAVAKEYFSVLQQEGLSSIGRFMHPKALKEFKEMLIPAYVAEFETGGHQLLEDAFGKDKSITDIKKMDPLAFMNGFMGRSAAKLGDLKISFDKLEILGTIAEGDARHVLVRISGGGGGVTLSAFEVLSFIPYQKSWRLQLNGNIRGIASAIRSDAAKKRFKENTENLGTSLLNEVKKENIDGVKALIKSGVNIKYSEGKNGVSALHLASSQGNLELVKIILDAGADINQKDNLGITALHSSIRKKHEDVYKFLRSNGAELSITSKGLTPLMFASAVGSNDLVGILLNEGEGINTSQPDGWTSIMHAAYFGHYDTVKILVKNHADVRALTNDKKTAADFAFERGHLEIFDYLKSLSISAQK